MNRDMDVVRRIVLGVRDTSDGSLTGLGDVPEDVFNYHAQLVIEAGLVHGLVIGTLDDNYGIPGAVVLQRLTWEGHDFADSITDDTVWKAAKEKVLKPSASWTFAILKEWIKFEIKRRIGMDGS